MKIFKRIYTVIKNFGLMRSINVSYTRLQGLALLGEKYEQVLGTWWFI